MQAIGQIFFSKESALNFVSTFAVGLVPSRFTHITAKESALIGTVAGGLTSLSNAVAGKDAAMLKRALFSTVALALTYFSFARLAPLLNKRLMVQLYPAAILQVLAFNALGHVASFVITKVYLTTFWNMSDEQIKSLHAKYENDSSLYDKLSNVEKLLLYHRFDTLELNTNNVEEEPTKDEIEALTDDQVRTLHEHKAYLSKDSDNEALLLRYYNLNLAPFEDIEDAIESLPLVIPKTVEDVDKIGDNQLKWYAIYFERHDDKTGALPKDVHTALSKKNVLKTAWNMSDEQIKSLHAKYENDPSLYDKLSNVEKLLLYHRFDTLELNTNNVEEEPTKDEIEALTDDQVRTLHEYKAYLIKESDNEALLLRYYNLNLAPFEDIEDAIEKLPLVIPKTVEDVNKIGDNQLKWYAIYFEENKDKLEKLPENVHRELLFRKGINRTIEQDAIPKASSKQVKLWAELANKHLEWWVSLAPEIQKCVSLRIIADELTVPKHFHPVSSREVKAFKPELVNMYYQHMDKLYLEFNLNIVRALNLRFYELKLPFPNGKTITSFKKQNKSLPDVKVPLPKTAAEVAKLDPNQLPWVFATLNTHSGIKDLPIEVQISLNRRFWNTLDLGWHYLISINKLKVEDIQKATKTTLDILLADFKQQLFDWIAAPKELFEAFQKKLAERKCKIVTAFINLDKKNLDQNHAQQLKAFFAGKGSVIWERLEETQKKKYWNCFKQFSLVD